MRKLALLLLLLLLPSLALAQPTMPVGIPAPSFPADLDADHPAFPSPWNGETAGYYYVNPAAGCNDSRTYGYPGTARCTPPSGPAAGAVVALDGTFGTTSRTLSWPSCTIGNPCWIVAYDNANKPTLQAGWTFGGQMIISGLAWSYNSRYGNPLGPNILLRWCEYTNDFDGASSSSFSTSSDNVTVYRNKMKKNGTWNLNDVDIDRHNFLVMSGADNVWYLYNEEQHHRGDGIQIGGSGVDPTTINRIFVGGNTFTENNQYGGWVKSATDVIFSQNTASGMTQDTVSGRGGCFGAQYYARYVWWILNTCYGSNNGWRLESASSAGNGPFYMLGNVGYNIGRADNTCTNSPSAVAIRFDGTSTVAFNTFDNNAANLYIEGNRPTTYRNNILHRWNSKCSYNIQTGSTPATMNYNLYDNDAQTVVYNGSTYTSLATFATARSQEANRVVADPAFTSQDTHDYSLGAASPAIDNAAVESAFDDFYNRYGIDIKKDIAGTVRPQVDVWDIGAYEYTSGGVADNTAPTVPGNVATSGATSSGMTVTWDASTDAVGVTGYHVYRDGGAVATLGVVTTFTDSGLSASTQYSYTVSAFDAVGNTSAQSDAATGTTTAVAAKSNKASGRGGWK